MYIHTACYFAPGLYTCLFYIVCAYPDCFVFTNGSMRDELHAMERDVTYMTWCGVA